MPLYEFECQKCGRVHELILPSSESEKKEVPCESCAGGAVRILCSPPRKTDCGDNSYPYVEENMGPEPILLESSAHRRAELKRRGLAEGFHRKPGMPGQWI